VAKTSEKQTYKAQTINLSLPQTWHGSVHSPLRMKQKSVAILQKVMHKTKDKNGLVK